VLSPFLWPSCAWAAGIWAGDKTGLTPGTVLALGGACLAAGWLSFFIPRSRSALAYLILSAFFLGAAALSVQKERFEANAAALGLKGMDYLDLHGRLVKSPSRGIDQDYLFLRLEKAELRGGFQPQRANIRAAVPHSRLFPNKRILLAGDKIRLTAKIIDPVEYRNFGPLRSAPYLRSQNIQALAFAKSPLFVERTGRAGPLSLRRAASRVRQSFQDRLEAHFPDSRTGGLSRAGAVLEALLLGERRRMDEEATLAFQESGLLHLIAISGAHIGIISMLLMGLFKLLGLAPRPSALLLILILVFYSILVESSASVLRSTIIAVSYLTGRLLWRESRILNSLAYSALVLLFLNPSSLFDPGFQLTYAATLAIVLFQPRIVRFMPRLPLRAGEALALSLAAQAGVTPLIAADFNRVTLAPLLLNLPAVPLVAAIMAGGYVFFPAACLVPAAAGLLGAALKLMTSLLLFLSASSGVSPLLSFRIPDPPPFVILAYYAFLGGLLLPAKLRGKKIILASGLVLASILMVIRPAPAPCGRLRMTVLDVGQGDAILVEFPGRMIMLVDGGGASAGSFDPGEKVVSPALWRKGVRRLDIIVATHSHPDHIKGLTALARNFKPKEFWAGPAGGDDPLRGKLEASLPRGTVRKIAARGFQQHIEGVLVESLHPGPEAPLPGASANDRSLVLRISWGRTAFLLTGDIGLPAEETIGRSGLPLRAGVLKAGHHGSDSSCSPEFLRRVSPRLAVISVGRNNAFGLPKEATLLRLRTAGASSFRTDRDGAVEVTSNGWSYSVRTAAQPDRIRVFR